MHWSLALGHWSFDSQPNSPSNIMTDPLVPLLLILRYMHILGAIALMGGTIFMRFALRPVVVQLPTETKATVHEEVRRRWARFVMLATLLILISGLINLMMTGHFIFE